MDWTTLHNAGSSPLTRGKPFAPPPRKTRIRLIPAHAGKTRRRRARSLRRPAHPRSRGENRGRSSPSFSCTGSSPLTRGKPDPVPRRLKGRRLIPAHAGKTNSRSPTRSVRVAHPRSRGENRIKYIISRDGTGSSPLTRGKLGCAAGRVSGLRLIPAHAGKTPSTH